MNRIREGTLRTGHVGLNVTDVDRSVEFYQTILGLDCTLQSQAPGEEWAILRIDRQTVLSLWKQSRGHFPVDRPGLHHLSFQVGSIDEVLACQLWAREVGVEIYHGGVVPHCRGMDSGGVFFTDPDGIRLEFFSRTGAGTTPAPNHSAPTCGFY